MKKLLAFIGGLALLVALPIGVGTAGAQSSDPVGPMTKVRLAHLSPDTPEVDIYATGADGVETKVLSSVAFRDVSEYINVPVGPYAFGMRPAGAPVSEPVVLSATAVLEGGEAFTFAAFGPTAEIQTQLIEDELRTPGSRRAAVRMFQASPELGAVSVSVENGPEIYSSLDPGTASGYVDVTAGSQKVIITPDDPAIEPFETTVALDAGSVVTLILGGKSASMDVMSVVDAAGTDVSVATDSNSALPEGGIATGGGGLAGLGDAQPSGSDTAPFALLLGAGALLALASGSVVLARRRADVRA